MHTDKGLEAITREESLGVGRVVVVFNFAVEGRGESWGVCKVEDVAVVLFVDEEGW